MIKNKIKWITTDTLTMDKWDELTILLKENNLNNLLDIMYLNTNKDRNMKDTILESAQ